MNPNNKATRDFAVDRRKLMQLTGLSVASIAGAGIVGTIPSAGAQGTERPILKVGVPGITESLDPHLDNRNQRTLVAYSLFDSLIARDYLTSDPPGTGAETAPMLATAWTRIDDLTLDVTLREGVTFHNGQPLTAEDVKFTFERTLLDPEGFPQAVSTLGTITSVEIVDATTVRFKTATPDPVLEKRLTTFSAWIISKSYLDEVGAEEFGIKPVGTGPYRFVEYRPDDALILESYDDYWGGLPPAVRIEFRIIPEVAARVAALASGEIDLATGVPPDQIAAIEGAEGFEVRGAPLGNIRMITYNTRLEPLTDVRLRRALSLAIDRQLIIDTLWGGRAVLPRGPQFESYGPLFNPERPYPAYDPDQARALITESSYAGETISIWLPADYYTLGEDVTQTVVEMWNEVGINAEMQLMTIATFYDDADKKTIVSGSDGNEYADPDAWWFRWGPGTTVEQYFWTPESPRFYEAGQEARATLDVAERFALYQEAIDIWEEEAPGTVLYTPIEQYGVRADISWLPYSLYVLDFRPGNLKFA